MKKLIATLLIIATFPAYGADDVSYLKKGDPAPFTGYLISPEKADSIREMKIDLDTQKQINGLLLDNQKIYEQRVDNLRKQSEDLAKQVETMKDSSMFTKVGFFVLGSVLTGLVAYGTTRVLR